MKRSKGKDHEERMANDNPILIIWFRQLAHVISLAKTVKKNHLNKFISKSSDDDDENKVLGIISPFSSAALLLYIQY